MNDRRVVSSERYRSLNNTSILVLLLMPAMIMLSPVSTYAATIILNTGAAIKGKILEEKEDSILIQNAETKQVIKIKLETMREIMLDPDEKKLSDKNKKLKLMKEDIDILSVLQPSLGILPGIAYPFGKIGTAIKLGYGGHLFFDLRMPMSPVHFQIRLGLSAGFIFEGTNRADIAANLMMFPILIYGKFIYAFDNGLNLFLKAGGGITPLMAKSVVDMDPTAAFGIGLGYVPPKLPYIEFFIEAGMMMVFEKVRGDFITANVGVAFRFGAPKAESRPAGK